MEVGIALPTMAAGYDGPSLRAWCRGVDEGPFSSISTGERITFDNPELLTTLAACAALTRNVDIMANIVVAPLHRPALLAKQLATIDVLSEGRLVVGLGVGGRPDDYAATETPFERRHDRVDEIAGELRSLWSGRPPFDGADPVGPAPFHAAGPRLVSGALGPKGIARAAAWAEGITGFSISGAEDEITAQVTLARLAWSDAGRQAPPWLGSGTFCVLGVVDALPTLHRFAARYLSFLGDDIAEAVASGLKVADPDSLNAVLDAAEAAGIDEFTLVPGSWEIGCLEAIAEIVGARQRSEPQAEEH